jgi:SAM-dependent methyltransferase
VPDAIFADPRLAQLYDVVDSDRSDLGVYAALVDELGARRVIDVGCGTGTFACLLAARGLDVLGVDPAGASLDVARSKPGAESVTWVEAPAADVPPIGADLAIMTGNVAQVFLGDDEWSAALHGISAALRPGGWLVFEVRDPARRAWEGWTPDATRRTIRHPTVGDVVVMWTELTEVRLPFVSFRHVYEFEAEGRSLSSDSTLRFRTHDEIESSLEQSGFGVAEVRDAPDRPGLELVFVARRHGQLR